MTHSRREFLKSAAAATGLGAMATKNLSGPLILTRGSPNEKLVVAVVGLNGRGEVHAENFGRRMKNAEVAYLCDVDTNALAKGQKVFSAEDKAPTAIGDFRRALDD